jgi:hypothetical protein
VRSTFRIAPRLVAGKLFNSFGSRHQRRERALVAGEVGRVEVHAMQVGARFGLGRKPLARAGRVASVAHLVN